MTALVIVFGVAWVLTLILFVFVVRELSWVLKTNEWIAQQNIQFRRVVEEAHASIMGGTFGDDSHKFYPAKGGNIAFGGPPERGGTLLNHTTLVDMVLSLQDQRDEREAYKIKIQRSVKSLEDWHHENPVPPPPTWFGKRIAITL